MRDIPKTPAVTLGNNCFGPTDVRIKFDENFEFTQEAYEYILNAIRSEFEGYPLTQFTQAQLEIFADQLQIYAFERGQVTRKNPLLKISLEI